MELQRLPVADIGGALLTCVETDEKGRCLRFLPTCDGADCITESPAHPTVKRRSKRKKPTTTGKKAPKVRRLSGHMVQKTVVRTVGKDFPGKVVHGTTRVALKAYKAGTEPERKQKTLSEFGSGVIYVSEKKRPHQAIMFSEGGGTGHGGRTLAEFTLAPGTKVLDLMPEITRRPVLGHDVPLAFNGRPTFTDDMILWLNEARESRGVAPLPREEVVNFLDPTAPDFWGFEYPTLLVSYARNRGYGAIRLADETLILNRDVITSAKTVPAKERQKLREVKAVYPRYREGLYTESFHLEALGGDLLTCARWIVVGKGADQLIRCGAYKQTCRPGDAECGPAEALPTAAKVDAAMDEKNRIIQAVEERPRTITKLAKDLKMDPKRLADLVVKMVDDKAITTRMKRGTGALVVPIHYQESLKDYEEKVLQRAVWEPGATVQEIADKMWLHPIFVYQVLMDLETKKLITLSPGPPKLAKDYDIEKQAKSRVSVTPEGSQIAPAQKSLNEVEMVRAVLSTEPIHIDEIGKRTGLTPYKVSSALVQLELKDEARQQAGKLFILAPKVSAPAAKPPFGEFWFHIPKRGRRPQPIPETVKGKEFEDYLEAEKKDKGRTYRVFAYGWDAADARLREALTKGAAYRKEWGGRPDRGRPTYMALERNLGYRSPLLTDEEIPPYKEYTQGFTEALVYDRMMRTPGATRQEPPPAPEPWMTDIPFGPKDDRNVPFRQAAALKQAGIQSQMKKAGLREVPKIAQAAIRLYRKTLYDYLDTETEEARKRHVTADDAVNLAIRKITSETAENLGGFSLMSLASVVYRASSWL